MAETAPTKKRKGRLVPESEWRLNLGSHVELARAVLQQLKPDDKHPVIFTRGAFYKYEVAGGVWSAIQRHKVEQLVHTFDGAQLPDHQLRVTHGVVCGTFNVAASMATNPTFFDDAPRGLVFKNGFLEVTPAGATLRPHSPDHHATLALPFDFEHQLRPMRWLEALEAIFQPDEDRAQKIALLGEFAGACLLGIAPKFAVALVPIGAGANGKSVVIDVLSGLFPSEAVSCIPPQDLGQEYRRARLAGIRLNAVSELPESDILDSEPFKAVIDGSQIEGRVPREMPFKFRPIAGHIFAGNRLPGTSDQTLGFWRRMMPVTFNRIFKREEQDAYLAVKILSGERPAVTAWAIAGAVRLLKQSGYTVPPSVRGAQEDWQRNSDQVRAFYEERCKPIVDDGTGGAVVYREYVNWASANGHRPLASNKFFLRLLALPGVERLRRAEGNFYTVEVK